MNLGIMARECEFFMSPRFGMAVLLAVLLQICLFVLPSGAMAGETGQEFVVVREEGHYPPFEYMEEGEVRGVHLELVALAAKHMGVKFKVVSAPWVRALHMVQSGEAHAVLFVTRTKERDKSFIFYDANVLSHITHSFLTRKRDAKAVEYDGSMESLKDHVILQHHGYAYGEPYDSAEYLERHNLTSDFQVRPLLMSKRFDVAIVLREVYESMFRHERWYADLTFLEPPMNRIPQYAAFSRLHLQWAERFAKAMEAMRQSGEVRAIYEKYGMDD